MTAEHAAAAGGEVHVHDRRGQLDRSICVACDEPYVECSECGLYACLCFADEPVKVDWWWTPKGRADHDATTRATAADTVLATARRLCCGDNPAPHHAATDAHSQRMAFAEELARAVRGS